MGAHDAPEYASNGHGAEEVFSKYFAFVLPSKQPHKIEVVDLGNTNEIEALIRKYREAVSRELLVQMRKPTVDTEFPSNRTAALLHDRVLQPLSAWIDEFETWFVSPDGLLNTLVFDALPWKQQDELRSSPEDANRTKGAHQIHKPLYLADTREISYVTSGRDIVNWSGKPADDEKITIVADPDFDWQPEADRFYSKQTDRGTLVNNSEPDGFRLALYRQLDRGFGFEKLDGARHEAEEIAKLFNTKLEILVGPNATKANVKKIHSPKILHFATHGFYLDPAANPDQQSFISDQPALPNAQQLENPLMHCGLALAGVNTWLTGGVCPLEIGTGILTGEEISNLNLFGTKLVVLAACETGLGQLRFGDGVYGLRRSLILAGAESAVVSLWNVPDDATAILMKNYYKELGRGVGRSNALKNAKRALRFQNSGRWRHVGFWAGFILEGNPHPI
jgi:CHAT domain-containing protein